MSLITRCPSCGTMFKVVPDQLKIAQGWVRCGHCAEVFDARQSMQSGGAGQPPPGADQLSAAAEAARAAAATGYVEVGVTHNSAEVPDTTVAAPARPVVPRAVPRWIAEATQDAGIGLAQTDGGQQIADRAASSGPAWGHAPPDEFDPAAWKAAQDKRQQAEPDATPSIRSVPDAPAGLTRPAALDLPSSPSMPAPLVAQASDDELPAQAAPRLWGRVVRRDESEVESYISYAFDDSQYLASPAASVAMPIQSAPAANHNDLSFVRRAQRGHFWRQRRIRVWLALFASLLVVTLALQVGVQYRDEVAALVPETRPVLHAICDVAGCSVGPLRRIDAVMIDSSTFNKLGSDAFRLSFVIKNTATTALRVPSLEITLTDLQNQAVIRRVVSPSQFGVTAASIGPRAEVSGVLNIRVASDMSKAAIGASSVAGIQSAALQLPVAGYRVLAFYP